MVLGMHNSLYICSSAARFTRAILESPVIRSDPRRMRTKVHSLVIRAKLDCNRCHEKIQKAICSLSVCEINSNIFDEKSNTITLIGTFDPEKVIKKICQKAAKCIGGYEWSEVVKKTPDSGADSSSKKKDPPAPPKEVAAGGDKEKTKAGEKDGDKKKEKGSKGKEGPSSLELVGPVVMVVVPSPAPATPAPAPKPPAPAPVPDPSSRPPRELIAYAPVLAAAVGWCHCGPCDCGCYYQPCPRPGHQTRPCTCGCSNRSDPCSISSRGCPGQCHPQ